MSLVLGLLYSYYIIYWHEVYVDMAVRKLEDIGLAAFNTMVMKVVLGISGSLLSSLHGALNGNTSISDVQECIAWTFDICAIDWIMDDCAHPIIIGDEC